MKTLKSILTPYLGILALMTCASFLALLVFTYSVWKAWDKLVGPEWTKGRLML